MNWIKALIEWFRKNISFSSKTVQLPIDPSGETPWMNWIHAREGWSESKNDKLIQ